MGLQILLLHGGQGNLRKRGHRGGRQAKKGTCAGHPIPLMGQSES